VSVAPSTFKENLPASLDSMLDARRVWWELEALKFITATIRRKERM